MDSPYYEGQLATVLESITDAFFSVDREFCVTYVNSEAERLLKRTRAEMLGKSLWALFPEAVGSKFEREYRTALESGTTAHFEEFYPPLDQWYEVRAYPSTLGLSVFFTQITERKQMEDALRFLAHCGEHPGEDFFQEAARYLARSLQMDYVFVDRLHSDSHAARTLAFYANGRFETNVTYELKDTPCSHVTERKLCCFPEGVQALYPKDDMLRTLGAQSYLGASLVGSDGRAIGLIAVVGRKPLEQTSLATSLVRVVALRAAGELERRMAEERLRQSEEFNRSIISSSTDCIKILDLQGRLRFMNEGGQRLLGIKDINRYLGMLYRDFWGEADKPKVEEALAQGLAGETGGFSAMVPTLDGRPKWWNVLVSPIRGQNGLPDRLLVVSRDVTAQHEAASEMTWLASFPEQNPNPIVELQLDPLGIHYMNPAASHLLPELREAGPAHPWVSGIAALAKEQRGKSRAPVSREIRLEERYYRQEVSRVPGHDMLRIEAFDMTELKEAQRLLEEQPKRLGTLIRTSQEMLLARTVPELLDLAASAAAEVAQAHLAVCAYGFKDGQFRLGVSAQGVTHPDGKPLVAFKMERGGVYQELLTEKASIRYSDAELKTHPLWRGLPEGHSSLRGLLGVRLAAADETACGVLMASDRDGGGEFTAEDEALFVQLGLTASLALRHLQAKEQAETRATELNAVIDSMADAVIFRRPDDALTFANPAASKLFGVKVNEAGETAFHARLREEGGAPVPNHELPGRRAHAGEQLRGERFLYTSPDGRELTLVVSASPLQVGGIVRGSVSVWHDITERENLLRRLAAARGELELAVQQRTAELQRAILDLEQEIQQRSATERALTESEHRYRTLVEAAPVGICVTTFPGQVLAANRSLCDMFGIPYGTASGRKVRDFYANASDSRRLRNELRKRGTISNCQMRLRKLDGELFDAVLHANKIRLGDRDVLLTIAEDVTAERAARRHVEGIQRLLGLFATQTTRADYLGALARLVRDWSGCSCAGIRIGDGKGHLLFAAQTGFNRAFIKQENSLTLDDNECPCMRVLSGRANNGDNTRNRERGPLQTGERFPVVCTPPSGRGKLACKLAGYQSVAQAAIRHEGELLGTVHVADRKPGRITPEVVAFMDSVAPLIGEALHRFSMRQSLTESEEKFRALFEKHGSVLLLARPETFALVDANPAACAFLSHSREQLLMRSLPELGITLPSSAAGLHHKGGAKATESFEVRLPSARGIGKTVAVHCSGIRIRREPLLMLMLHDITERKLLQKRLLEIGEEERQRVGQDLHDSLGGHLTGIALLGKALAQRLQERKSPERELATEVVEGLNQAVVQTRNIAHGLCPVEQNEFGLLSSLHEYAADLRRRTRVRCELHVAGGPPKLDAMVGSHLFRIVQEAVSNALRHAKARRLRISLSTTQREFALRVWNDGAEFPERAFRGKGLGLRTMKYRADLIGAQFDISPAAGGGTVVSCLLPAEAVSARTTQGGM
jgi:PAS domain S-box-containing protein